MPKNVEKSVDDKTLKLIEEVQKRKLEIASAEKPTWITNRSFSYVEGNSSVVNLAVVTNVETLLKIAAFLRNRELCYNSVAEELDLKDFPKFRWDGFTVNEWLS